MPASVDDRRPLLTMRGIVKRYGALTALDGVDFDLHRGEVHALLGENGAGKTTLMRCLYGLEWIDDGQVEVAGEPVEIDSPRTAIALGIGMVHQHFMLVDVLTVAENVLLGREPARAGVLADRAGAHAEVRELADRYGLAVKPEARARDLTVGEQQRVEILRALHGGARILILDEPTGVLTTQEAAELFSVMRALAAAGTAIVLISHKLGEVCEMADRITILRRGRRVETLDRGAATETRLAHAMVGRDVVMRIEKRPRAAGDVRLHVEGLTVDDDRGLPAVRGVDVAVRAGEIVAIAGVDGNGQAELVEAVAGLRDHRSGAISVDGRRLRGGDVREALAAGIRYIAEDRQRRGLVLDFDLAENLCLRAYRRTPVARRGWLSRRRMVERATPLLAAFDVRGGDAESFARSLSGGNQQKVVIARELNDRPAVLIAARPTRGLDVGAIEFVHRRLLAAREDGAAILLVSFELDEVRALADRLLVLYEGAIAGEFPPDVSDEELGLAMAGRREAA